MTQDPWRIPATHDPQTREHLARWEVLRSAGRFEWDAERSATWQQVPMTPPYAALRELLASAGLDPDTALRPAHDDCLSQLRERAAAWSVQQAAAAFVAGLWSAPAAWRSALPGVLIARVMPAHPFTPWSASSSDLCEVCGWRRGPVQLLQAWAFRLTAGTPLDGEPAGYAQVLQWLGDARPEPTEYDRWALGALRTVLRSLPAATRYSAGAKAIAAAKILRGAHTPTAVLEDLALVGVLAPPTHPGMAERFTSYRERDARPNQRVEVQAPLAWWDSNVGQHGVRAEYFDMLFGGLDIPTVSLDAPRPVPLPAAKDSLDGGLAARARALAPKQPKAAASVGDGPAAAGDVWAIRLEPGRWVTVYVHEVRERERAYAHAEFLAGVFSDLPDAADIPARVQPRRSGRAATWVHSLDRTPWMRRIAQGRHAPAGDGARPHDGGWGAAKELRHLSSWHYD